MQLDTPAANVSDDTVVERLYDLSRQGDTATREFQLLDYVIQKRLQQTYGGEFTRTAYAA
jgi:hypothetical protein